jgi:hypothetical protein
MNKKNNSFGDFLNDYFVYILVALWFLYGLWEAGFGFLKAISIFFAFLILAVICFSVLVNVLMDLEENFNIFTKSFDFFGYEINAFQKTFGRVFDSIKETDSRVIKILGYLILLTIALPILLFTGIAYVLYYFLLPIIILSCVIIFLYSSFF